MTHVENILLLQNLPDTGAGAYWRLLSGFPSLKLALNAPLDALQTVLRPKALEALSRHRQQGEDSALLTKVRKDLAWAQAHGVHLLDTDSERYPALLREIKRPPPLLFVRGNPAVLSLPQIAMVGSRHSTPGGRDNALHFAADLAANGVTITSGLALGVDVAAHQGALKNNGTTVAVIGTGIDQMYPARHAKIADAIVEQGGAIVSEFPLGTKALPSNFPQRNRIISGLSFGVLVVEAAVKSGSLITARYAIQQDREVFAIPGSIHNPVSRGCHALIKDGAKLVETPQDIVEELSGFLSFKQQELELSEHAEPSVQDVLGSEHEARILHCMGYDTVGLDLLVERTGLPAGELVATLLAMELRGLVGNVGHGYVRTELVEGRRLSV